MDNQKYILLTFLGAAVLLGTSIRGLVVPLLASMEIGDPRIFGFIDASALGGLAVGILTFFILNRNRAAYLFTDEVVAELRKVVWPDKQETVRSTLVVVSFMVIVAGALGLYDYIWAGITREFIFSAG
jgi:preprotein translocase subunit SecE